MRLATSARSATLALVGALLLPACREQSNASPVGPSVAQVSVQRVSEGIRLVNDGDLPIAYGAVEHEAFKHMLALWGPCPQLEQCTVPPGGSVVIPYSKISMYEPGAREAVVYWWKLVPHGPGDDRLEESQSLVVAL